MNKDIDKFIEELADYINRFIAGREGSHIEECMIEHTVLNRGHAIPIRCAVPGESNGRTIGPCFYAEELMKEFPHSSVAAIAEHVSLRTEEVYPGLVQTMSMQQIMESKNIRAIESDKLFLMAYMTKNVGENLRGNFITKEYKELGLTAVIKAGIDNPSNKNQIYLLPVMSDPKYPATDEDWKIAEHNSMAAARIALQGMSINENEPPVCGSIMDEERFYDYFYLLTPQVWKPVINHTHADKLYIFPSGTYNAKFCVSSRNIRSNSQASMFRDAFMRAAMTSMNGNDIFVLDCGTMKITKFKS